MPSPTLDAVSEKKTQLKAYHQGVLDPSPSHGVEDVLEIGLHGNIAAQLKLITQFHHAPPNGAVDDVTTPVDVGKAQHHSIVRSAANHPFADPTTRQGGGGGLHRGIQSVGGIGPETTIESKPTDGPWNGDQAVQPGVVR